MKCHDSDAFLNTEGNPGGVKTETEKGTETARLCLGAVLSITALMERRLGFLRVTLLRVLLF